MQSISFLGRSSRIHWRCKSEGINKLLRKQVNLIHIPHPKCLGCLSFRHCWMEDIDSLSDMYVCGWSSSKFRSVTLMDGDREGGSFSCLEDITDHFSAEEIKLAGQHGSKARPFSSPESLQMSHPSVSLSVSIVWYEFRETGWLYLWRKWVSVTTTLPDYKSNTGR